MRLKVMRMTAYLVTALALGSYAWKEYKKLQPQSVTLTTECGTVTVTEPVLLELLQSPVVNRMKKIQQYGAMHHARKGTYFTRYDHSLGVFVLLRRYGASLEEQIAGLLHDASHTVFSHVADHLFPVESMDNPYQDKIHQWYLTKQGVPDIMARHGFTADILDTDRPGYRRLEQDLPDVCADRLQYNLIGGLCENLLTQQDVDYILDHLKFEHDNWFFTDVKAAQMFSRVSLKLTEDLWGGAWNSCVSRWTAQALKRAADLGLITYDDIHFSVDEKVWETLCKSDDAQIQAELYKVRHYKECFALGTPEHHDAYVKAKFSGVDPLISTEQGMVRLSSLDLEYQKAYDALKTQVKAGYYVTFVEPQQYTAAATVTA